MLKSTQDLNRKEYNITVKNHANSLYGYAIRFLRNEEDAKDIVQDVFERLWVNRKKVEVKKAKSWMFTTAHNSMINFSVRKNRMTLTDVIGATEKSKDRSVETFELTEVIDLAVGILPPLQKSVILLRDLEGYSYKEIGEILELSDAQVKVYLFRARKKVKKQLNGKIELI